MGFRFRKSIKAGPLKINMSKSGIGYSVGGKGFRVTKKVGGGTRTTASIPGTGISYTKDSGGKKNARIKTSVKSSGTYTPSSQNKTGCLPAALWVVGALLVIGIIRDYWWCLLLIGLIGGAAYLLFRRAKNQKELNAAEETSLPVKAEPSTEGPLQALNAALVFPTNAEPSSEDIFQARKATLIARFESELAAIPIKELPVSEPIPRQLLKDLPPYDFSNITRKTRLDSIFPLVVLDIETTDLRPAYGEIIEVSAIKFEAGMIPVEAITTLCNAKKPIPAEATAINHITDDMVQNYPRFAEIAPAVADFLKGCHLAGHNLDFDLRFIHANGVKLPEGTRFYDTLDLAHLTVPSSNVWDYKLDTLCHYYSIWREDAHRALSDCYATSKLFASLVKDKTDRQLIADPDGEMPVNGE